MENKFIDILATIGVFAIICIIVVIGSWILSLLGFSTELFI